METQSWEGTSAQVVTVLTHTVNLLKSSAYTWIYSSSIPSNPSCLFALSVLGWTGSPPAAAVSLPILSPRGWWSFAHDGVAAETFQWSPFC